MSKEIVGNQRHMSLDDRIYIEKCLDKDMTFKDVAKFLRKDPTTISKEVKKNRIYQQRNSHTVAPNDCKYKRDCHLKNVCNYPMPCNKRCSLCASCKKRCGKYIPGTCKNLDKSPFVCNGCAKKFQCRMDKYYYRAAIAHDRYRNTLSSCREGIHMTEIELCELDEMVTPLIKNGQSIAHIFAKHKDEIPFTSRTLYNYVEQNVLRVRNIDLPRKVKYKPRKGPKQPRREHAWLEGRRYSNFTDLLLEYPETPTVEMDTVEGVSGGKVLLTMLFRNSRCMFAFLLPGKKQEYVLDVFNRLEKTLGTILFLKTFPVILTDNGSEFLNPLLLETGFDSFIRTSVYYCDPNASYQKGALEKNHEYIRYVIPKGTSLDSYTQDDITLMINHINSTARDSLNGRNPFELASLLLDHSVIKTLGLKKIEHDDVRLKPSLLRK
jgi:transposase, IS30 family